MNKKIVIAPIFCETHLVKHQIPNIIDIIDPDIIIYNEGMWPNGTEGEVSLSKEWLDKYTLNGEGKRGFDFNELKQVINEAQEKYPDTKIILNEMDFSDCIDKHPYDFVGTKCYVKANSNFKELGIDVQVGDYIFLFEGDTFYHEDAKDDIQGYVQQLELNTGFRSIVVDFIQNQHYTECVNWQDVNGMSPLHVDNPYSKSRRVCVRVGESGEFYHNVLSNFMTQDYSMLYPTELMTYHYAWWRPGKYLDLRCEQLMRSDNYWKNYCKGLEEAKKAEDDLITVRPTISEDNPRRYIKKISISHPKHIKEHINWRNDEN
jgi:hypothetical protein